MQCWKKKYSKREAQETLNYLRGHARRGDKKLHAYLCPNGKDHYHLTHSEW
jgi:hypothetical protein